MNIVSFKYDVLIRPTYMYMFNVWLLKVDLLSDRIVLMVFYYAYLNVYCFYNSRKVLFLCLG